MPNLKPLFQKVDVIKKMRPAEAKQGRIKQLLKEVLYNSLAQATIRIFASKHLILRVYLFFFVIVTTSLASYMVLSTVLSYLSYEVTTTSRTLYETPTLFPQITFCTWNQFTSADSIPLLRDINMQVNASIDIFDQEQMNLLDNGTKYALIGEIYDLAIVKVMNKSFSDTERQKLAHTLDDVLMACTFNYEDCSPADFTWSFSSSDGNCFTFNSGRNWTGEMVSLRQSNIAGSINGLYMQLYVNFHENLTYFNSYTGDGLGAVVYIDNSSSAMESRDFGGVIIAPGYQTNVAIGRSFVSMLPKPYSNCDLPESTSYSSSLLVNLIHNSSYKYTQQLCFEQCYQMKLINECNCTELWLLSLFHTKKAYCDSQSECQNRVSKTVYNDVIGACGTLCPLECNINKFETQMSFFKLNGQIDVDYIKENPNLAADFVTKPIDVYNAKESVLQVYLYYDTLSYKMSTELPQMNFVSLLANIGGNLGLFLGVSVFSVCELVEFLIESFYILKEKHSIIQSLP